MKCFLLIPVCFCFLTICIGQKDLKKFRAQLLSADSVWLVSHELTDGVLVDSATEETQLPKIVKNKKPNDKIIIQKKRMVGDTLQKLANILCRQYQDSISISGNCRLKQHAILIFKKGRTSYIDISFGCGFLTPSGDLHFSNWDMDRKKWYQLEKLFRDNGMTFDIPI